MKIKKYTLSVLGVVLIIFGSLGLANTAFAQPCSISPIIDRDACIGAGGTWTGTASGGLIDVIQKLQGLLNAIVPLLVALGVVYFVWGVVQYVVGDGEEAKTKGRDRMIYGIIGLAVIIGVWGLVGVLMTTFGIDGGTAPDVSNLLPS